MRVEKGKQKRERTLDSFFAFIRTSESLLRGGGKLDIESFFLEFPFLSEKRIQNLFSYLIGEEIIQDKR